MDTRLAQFLSVVLLISIIDYYVPHESDTIRDKIYGVGVIEWY